MGMVFYLPAFFLAILAGIGLDRLLSGAVPVKTVLITCGVFTFFALLGALGALQSVAEALALPERAAAVQANAGELRTGALRLLVFALLNGAAVWSIATKRLSARAGTAALLVVLVADLWSINRLFFEFSPRANVLFRDDSITSYMKKVPPPYRVFDVGNSYGEPNSPPTSVLMAYRIPQALGYHGFDLQAYRELGGRDNGWQNLSTPNLLSLLSIRFLILPEAENVPGYHQVVAPTTTAVGNPATLYEADSTPPYARVMPTAAKLPDSAVVATLVDRRFPFDRVALFADTSSVTADSIVQPLPTSSVHATVRRWTAGRMAIALDGTDPRPGHLIVSENWYKDWHATVDGRPAIARRANHSLLSVEVPTGAKSVELWVDSASYARGKMWSAAALVAALLMVAVGIVQDRRRAPLRARTP
jgi:hypothetical protein